MTTFTREEFEHAARAVGIQGAYAAPGELGPSHPAGGIVTYLGFGSVGVWCPPHDDGDALRLAVKLFIDIKQYADHVVAWFDGGYIGTGRVYYDGDPYEATRYAIFRAAIAIGKAMVEPDVRPKTLADHLHVGHSSPDHQTTTLFHHPDETPGTHDPV